MKRLLLAICLFAGALWAADATRNRTPGSSNVRQGATLPSTCRPSPDADVFYKSGASAGLYVCTATNTWTADDGLTDTSGTVSGKRALSVDSLTTVALTTPTITSVTPSANNAVTCTYTLVLRAGDNVATTAASAAVSTAVGPTNCNSNTIVFTPDANASYAQLSRTVGGTTQGLITAMAAWPINSTNCPAGVCTYVDTGSAASGAASAVNTTGRGIFGGQLSTSGSVIPPKTPVSTYAASAVSITTPAAVYDICWMSNDRSVVYACGTQDLYRSGDSGVTWEALKLFAYTIGSVRELANGELLVGLNYSGVTPGSLYLSSGYASLGVNATWTKVLDASAAEVYFEGHWGISTYKNIVVASEYGVTGAAGARYVYMSTNYGVTWTSIFDLGGAASAHVHGAAYDPWWDAVWVVNGDDAANRAVRVSFDHGSTWTVVTSQTSSKQFVGIIPLPNCVLFTSDDGPNGVYRIPRTPDRTVSAPVMAYQLSALDTTQYVGGMPFRAPGENMPTILPFLGVLNAGVVLSTYDGYNFSTLFTDTVSTYNNKGPITVVGPTLDGSYVGVLMRDDGHKRLAFPGNPVIGPDQTRAERTSVLSATPVHWGGTSQNMLTYSQLVSNAAWTKSGLTVTEAQLDPLGGVTAEAIVEDGTAGGTLWYQSPAVANGSTYVISAYFKRGVRGFAYLGIYDSAAQYAWFNLATGAVGTKAAGLASSGMISVGNGWYRCWAVRTTNTIGGLGLFGISAVDNVVAYAGTSGYIAGYAWGAQLSSGNRPGIYAPTTATATAPIVEPVNTTTGTFSGIVSALPGGTVPAWAPEITAILHGSTWTTCTSASPIVCTMTAHGLPTGASAVWVAGGTGDWAALNGTQTVTWASTTTYSIAVDGSTWAAFGAQAITAASWGVTSKQDVAAADALTQDLVLLALPAKWQVDNWRVKSAVACTGPATLKTGLGTTANNVLFRAQTYDLEAAVSDTNLTTGPTAGAGADTAAGTNLVASLISTTNNINTTANGCSVKFHVLYGVLP